jgi:putative endonuclease
MLAPLDPRWLVYLLRCSDGSLYTGIINDLPKRLKAHAAGKASRYTRSRLPVKVAYSEPQTNKSAGPEAGGGHQEAATGRERQVGGETVIGRAYFRFIPDPNPARPCQPQFP